MIRQGRDLRQMRDGNDLLLAGHAVHEAGHFFSNLPAHTGVNFVEHNCGEAGCTCSGCFERQHQAAFLASRSHFMQGQRWVSGVGRKGDDDFFNSVLVGFSEGLPFKSQRRFGHAQALERSFDGTGQFFSHSLPTSHQGIARSPRFLAFDFECIFRCGIGFVDACCFGQLFREALFEPLQFTGIRGVVLVQDALEFMVESVELIKPMGI